MLLLLWIVDLDARPWDFQAEECALRASVDRFNNRRYCQINATVCRIYFDTDWSFEVACSFWFCNELRCGILSLLKNVDDLIY